MNDKLFEPIRSYHIIFYDVSKRFSVVHTRYSNRSCNFNPKEPWETTVQKLNRIPKYMKRRVIKLMLQEWTGSE